MKRDELPTSFHIITCHSHFLHISNTRKVYTLLMGNF
jgi:hypothetical protein